MKDFQYLKNVATLRRNDKVCIGCGRCIECGTCSKSCPVAAGVGCALGMINEWLQGTGDQPAEHEQGALVP